jgi:hypothetical protein
MKLPTERWPMIASTESSKATWACNTQLGLPNDEIEILSSGIRFLEVHDILLVLKLFIGDFFLYFWHSLRDRPTFINFLTKGFQSHH